MRRSYFRSFFTSDTFHSEIIAVALAIYFSAFLNGPLWDALLRTQSGVFPLQRWLFVWTAIVGITAFQALFISLLLWGRVAKWVAAILVLITSVTHYFSQHYGTFFDKSMIRNVLQTNVNEAGELITLKMLTQVVLYALPAILFLIFYRSKPVSLRHQLGAKAVTVTVTLMLVMGAVALQFKSLASAMRNHRDVRHLILPSSPTLAMARALGEDAAEGAVARLPLDSAATRVTNRRQRPLLTVVVVGETVRAQNWGLSGYTRQTTPKLAMLSSNELFNSPYLRSCGTNTEVSVPCMFSGIGRQDYDEKYIKSNFSVLHLLQQTGVHTTWIDNQSGCKGACDGVIRSLSLREAIGDVRSSEFLLDGYFLGATKSQVLKLPADQIVVLHMIGNHGPAYSRRYPAEFKHFVPVCEDVNLTNCDTATIVNAYDNAVRYTDSVLAELIAFLNRIQDRDVAMIYVSDHGESLGEGGLYLHGLPYAIAPDVQTRVPFVFWMPLRSQRNASINTECVKKQFGQPNEHDVLAHTLLGLYRVNTRIYRPKFDLIQICRDER